MPLAGRQWKPREVCALLWDAGWVNAENLMIMCAVVGAESAFYEHAWHWNENDGTTDWGLFELNDGNEGGVAPDDEGNPQPGGIKSLHDVIAFRDMAWTPDVAVVSARTLYVHRSFSPWAAYVNHSWEEFIPQASRGVMNMLRVKYGLVAI